MNSLLMVVALTTGQTATMPIPDLASLTRHPVVLPLPNFVEAPEYRIKPRGISYTVADVPLWYQGEQLGSGRAWFAWDEHPTSSRPVTNPNQRYPWARPAGTTFVKGLEARRWIDVPKDKKILVWSRRISSENNGRYRFGSGSHDHYYWRFPVGTTVFERLSTSEGPFVLRMRHKASNTGDLSVDWRNDEEFVADIPPGYAFETKDCIDCHQDAGQHVSRLPNRLPDGSSADWYQYLKGGLKDRSESTTVFTFRPVNHKGEVLPIFRDIVKVVD